MGTEKSQVELRLRERGIGFESLAAGSGATLIVTERWGRAFLFLPDGSPVFWLNEAWGDSGAFERFIASDSWNAGGERVWVAPEIQFHIRDRSDFWRSYHLPRAVDPGNWVIGRDERGHVRLSQTVVLQAFNAATGTVGLAVERWISPIPDPLRHIAEYGRLRSQLAYAGYAHTITFRLLETAPDARSAGRVGAQAWNLIQLYPGGEVLVPTASAARYTDYMEPVPPSFQQVRPNLVRVRITGDRRFKVGYCAACHFGRAGYLRRLSGRETSLVVRYFPNDPSAEYLEEPAGLPGHRGDSLYVYNDGGMFGGFGELECLGRAIGGETGRTSSSDEMLLWVYWGADDAVRSVASQLLGTSSESG